MSSAVNGQAARQLSSGQAFRLRMESQCHQIEQYRISELRDAGRKLTADEAALEWIEHFAEDFARGYEPPLE